MSNYSIHVTSFRDLYFAPPHRSHMRAVIPWQRHVSCARDSILKSLSTVTSSYYPRIELYEYLNIRVAWNPNQSGTRFPSRAGYPKEPSGSDRTKYLNFSKRPERNRAAWKVSERAIRKLGGLERNERSARPSFGPFVSFQATRFSYGPLASFSSRPGECYVFVIQA